MVHCIEITVYRLNDLTIFNYFLFLLWFCYYMDNKKPLKLYHYKSIIIIDTVIYYRLNKEDFSIYVKFLVQTCHYH